MIILTDCDSSAPWLTVQSKEEMVLVDNILKSILGEEDWYSAVCDAGVCVTAGEFNQVKDALTFIGFEIITVRDDWTLHHEGWFGMLADMGYTPLEREHDKAGRFIL